MGEAIKMGGGTGRILNSQEVTGYGETENIKPNTFVEYSRVAEVIPVRDTNQGSYSDYTYFYKSGASFLQLNDRCVIIIKAYKDSDYAYPIHIFALFSNDDFGDFSTDFVKLNTNIATYPSSAFYTVLAIKKLTENEFIIISNNDIGIFSVDIDNKSITQLSLTTIKSLTGQNTIAYTEFVNQNSCFFGATNRHIFFGGVENYSGATYPLSFIYFKINNDYSISLLAYCYSGWIHTDKNYLPFLPEKGLDVPNNYCYFQAQFDYSTTSMPCSPKNVFNAITNFDSYKDSICKFNIKLTETGIRLESVDNTNLLFTAESLLYFTTYNVNEMCLLHKDNKQVICVQYSDRPVYYSIVNTSNGHIIPEHTLAVQYSYINNTQSVNSYAIYGHTVNNNKNLILNTLYNESLITSNSNVNSINTFKKLICNWELLSITTEDVPLFLGDDYHNFIAPIFYADNYFYQIPVYGYYSDAYSVCRKSIDDTSNQWELLVKISSLFSSISSTDSISDMFRLAHSSMGKWILTIGTNTGSSSYITDKLTGVKNIVFNLFKKSVSKIIGVSKTSLKPNKLGKVEILE